MGGGDCDLGTDASGRVYLADSWLGGVSVSSSSDRGATWRGAPLSVAYSPLDRPWVLGGDKDEVFVTAAQPSTLKDGALGLNAPANGGIFVARSTDGGQTFRTVQAVGNEGRLTLNSNIAGDTQHLYLMYGKKVSDGKLAVMVAVSSDRGTTWEQRVVAEQNYLPGACSSPLNIFPVVAADGSGGVYLAWALENADSRRVDLFMASSRDGGATWSKPVLVADRPGTRYFPWIAADGPGRVGLVWYETNATLLWKPGDGLSCTTSTPPDAAWFLRYAFSGNALDEAPAFAETLVQSGPTHLGTLGQPYAEVLQVRFTPDGRAATAYVADVPEGKARPMFAIQASPS
jgi:hypothetical protein